MQTVRRRPAYFTTLVTAALFLITLLALGVVGAGETQDHPGNSTRATGDTMLSGWPAGPRLAGQETMAKYGAPQETTADRVIWHNAGPFKRIMLTREQLPHDFPITHMDYLEHTISYNVPPDKTDEVHAFDASITIYRVAGELSARCDLESNNVLTLNLANDIVAGKKSVDDARKEFGQAVTDRTLGQPPASTMALQFQPARAEAAADREKTTIPGSPQRAMASNAKPGQGAVGTSGTSATGKPGGDADLMAQLIAIDENEVHAAMTAEQKKLDAPTMAFANTLHRDHGKDIQATQQLGMKIGVTPMESAAVDQIHDKGAQQLAKLVPLNGSEFASAFVAAMAAGHREALQMIDQFLKSAQNDAVKQHLAAARQHVAMHLKQAETMQKPKG